MGNDPVAEARQHLVDHRHNRPCQRLTTGDPAVAAVAAIAIAVPSPDPSRHSLHPGGGNVLAVLRQAGIGDRRKHQVHQWTLGQRTHRSRIEGPLDVGERGTDLDTTGQPIRIRARVRQPVEGEGHQRHAGARPYALRRMDELRSQRRGIDQGEQGAAWIGVGNHHAGLDVAAGGQRHAARFAAVTLDALHLGRGTHLGAGGSRRAGERLAQSAHAALRQNRAGEQRPGVCHLVVQGTKHRSRGVRPQASAGRAQSGEQRTRRRAVEMVLGEIPHRHGQPTHRRLHVAATQAAQAPSDPQEIELVAGAEPFELGQRGIVERRQYGHQASDEALQLAQRDAVGVG